MRRRYFRKMRPVDTACLSLLLLLSAAAAAAAVREPANPTATPTTTTATTTETTPANAATSEPTTAAAEGEEEGEGEGRPRKRRRPLRHPRNNKGEDKPKIGEFLILFFSPLKLFYKKNSYYKKAAGLFSTRPLRPTTPPLTAMTTATAGGTTDRHPAYWRRCAHPSSFP